MSLHLQFSSGTSTLLTDQALNMNASCILSQNRNIKHEPPEDAEFNDDALRELKDLPDRSVDSITPGYHDTIDSILSRYGAIHNEIQRDSRIALVLGAELAITPAQRPLAVLADRLVDLNSTEGLSDLQYDMGSPQIGAAKDIMIEYAEYLSHAIALTPDDGRSPRSGNSISSNDASTKCDTNENERFCDDSEDTLSDMYVETNADLFHDKIEVDHPVEKESTAKSAVEAVVVFEDVWVRLPIMTDLGISPVVQVAFIRSTSTAQDPDDDPTALIESFSNMRIA